MAKGPIITDEVRLLISEVHIAHPHWQAKDVQHEVNVRMGGKGPRISAIQKQLTTVRKASASVSKNLEAPWSLGISADYGIPLETNEVLMKIWKWCAVVGMTLTIREAQWVARLRGIAPDDLLFLWAIRYARREQVCRLLGREEIYTADLDIDIVFPTGRVSWTPHGAEAVWAFLETWKVLFGMPYGKVLAGKPHSKDELAFFRQRVSEMDDWDKTNYASMNTLASQKVENYLYLDTEHKQTLGKNTDMIYAVWLRLFASSPKWKNMNLETKSEMAMRLHKEIELKEEIIKDTIETCQDSITEDEKWRLLFSVTGIPSEELRQDVGVPQERAHWKLVTLESEVSAVTCY